MKKYLSCYMDKASLPQKSSLQKKPTAHGMMRAEERLGISDIENYAKGALHCGLRAYDVSSYPHLSEFLEKRQSVNKHHLVVLYKGACFIFVRSSSRLITCFKLEGEELLEEYEQIRWKENSKRIKYRASKRKDNLWKQEAMKRKQSRKRPMQSRDKNFNH